MTCTVQNTQFDLAMELLIENGFDGVADAIAIMMNGAMQIERSRYLRAQPYERTDRRRSYANGFKPKSVKTRVGEIELAIPQTRDGVFYPGCLERGLRSERALKIALAEMYVQGVSTRKVAKITEELCGFEISSSEVSRASAELDKQLGAWRSRKLESFPYVYLDARYEKVRHGGVVISVAVLIAVGVDLSGHRELRATIFSSTGTRTGDLNPISSRPCRAYTNSSRQTGKPVTAFAKSAKPAPSLPAADEGVICRKYGNKLTNVMKI